MVACTLCFFCHSPAEERKSREDERRQRAVKETMTAPSSEFLPRTDSAPPRRNKHHVHFSFSVKDLVLLHPPTTDLPSGTRYWFQPRPHMHTYHHVRMDLASHYDRLARYLANKSVGVTLGGGGARGLAHQGVLQAMCELSIPVDFIGGTSQGSLMSGLYAQLPSITPASLGVMRGRSHEMARQVGSLAILLSDATFPIMSYFSGKIFSDQIRAIINGELYTKKKEEVYIEDLWIKYFCISCNMSQADIVVHTSGLLWKAARASMSILEYLPPMQMGPNESDILIDGGYLNNCPVDVLRELFNPQHVIAVDVERKIDYQLQDLTYYGEFLNGWWLLYRKLASLLPLRVKELIGCAEEVKIPRYSELISALLFIQHNRNIRQFLQSGVMDVYVRPLLGDTQLLDYHKELDIYARGEKSAKIKLTEWRIVMGDRIPTQVDDSHSPADAAHSLSPDHRHAANSSTGTGGGKFVLPMPQPELSRSQTTHTVGSKSMEATGGESSSSSYKRNSSTKEVDERDRKWQESGELRKGPMLRAKSSNHVSPL